MPVSKSLKKRISIASVLFVLSLSIVLSVEKLGCAEDGLVQSRGCSLAEALMGVDLYLTSTVIGALFGGASIMLSLYLAAVLFVALCRRAA